MTISPWVGRAALLGLATLASVGLFYPEVRPTEFAVAPDQVSHALIIYGFTVAAAMAFPRIRIWVIGLVLFLGAIGVELLQGLDVLAGAYEVSDIVANGIGIAIALLPVFVTARRRRIRLAKRAGKARLDAESPPETNRY